MIKNDAGVILSCFSLQICSNKKEQYHCFKRYGFLDELNIMILFIDEYVTVFRRKQKSSMRSFFFFETSSCLDETGIFMNVSLGGADGGQMKTC